MAVDGRAQALAHQAAGLAAAAGIELPNGLQLWRQAGRRPDATTVLAAPTREDHVSLPQERGGDARLAAARALVAALEGALSDAERRQGAHYTPARLAAEVAERALPVDRVGAVRTVVDPSCGGGAILLAAAERLVALGADPRTVARDMLWGVDIDPVAAAVTEAAIALWSGGIAPERGHVVAADVLDRGRAAWPAALEAGFDAVIGNPPFQGQLATATTRSAAGRSRLRARFGPAAAPYVDTAAVFLLVGVDLASSGARVAMVQPQSTAAARDAGAVREALAARARLVELFVPEGRPFAGRVHVCVPVLEVGTGETVPDWAGHLAEARGVPVVHLGMALTVASMADAVAGFRQHYYGLVGHVHEATTGRGARLITSGSLGVGACTWGVEPIRFAKRRWTRPVVDLAGVRFDDPRLDRWLDCILRPKVVVATQTRVIEAAVDRSGTWVPCTPVVSVLPHDGVAPDLIAAALCAPPVAAWAARRASGTGLSPDAIRMTAALALAAPLPPDRQRWEAAAAHLAAGDLDAYAESATAMHRLPDDAAAQVIAWWRTRVSRRSLGAARGPR